MTSLLETQVNELQFKLSLAKAYRFLSEWFKEISSTNKKIITNCGGQEIMSVAVDSLCDFLSKKAEEIESGKYVEKMELEYEDIIIIKQLVVHLKNKNIKLGDFNV